MNEQHRILASDVEEYLRPIYLSDAEFVIVVHGSDYPDRVWTRFESDQFGKRFKDNAVIPVWVAPSKPSIGDDALSVGAYFFDPKKDLADQVAEICNLCTKKIGEKRAIT